MPTPFGLGLRLSIFFFLEILGLYLFGPIVYALLDYVAVGALSAFLSAVVANTIAVRIYERGQFDDVGMGWTGVSHQHLLLGMGIGAAAAALVVLAPVAAGLASYARDTAPGAGFGFGRMGFLVFLLVFGAVGEELLFRGYGFQVLLGRWGGKVAIPVFAAVFAWLHAGNLSVAGVQPWSATAVLAMLNTFLWGVLLGYAVPRSGALWLPIGLHFGWNLALPLLGVRLSGYTMGVTGYILQWRAGDVWSGGAYGPEASILTTLAVAGAGWMVYRARLTPQRLVLLEPNREQES